MRYLSRVTSSGEFIPEVDGIRFLAIAAVLIFHTTIDIYSAHGRPGTGWAENHGIILHLIGLGWFGVQIFFVLSGFIVALPFARHALQGSAEPSIGRYFLRRLTRIEPPYVLSLTAMYLLSCTWSGKWSANLPHLAASLFYSHQYIYGEGNPFDGATWSLEVEVGFYILAPLLAGVYWIRGDRRRWMVQLFAIGAMELADRWLVHRDFTRMHNLVIAMPFFVAGMLLADLYASGIVRRSATIGWDCAFAASVVLLAVSVPSQLFWFTPLIVIFMVAGVAGGRIANRILRLRAVTVLGGMCYTIYLWHLFLLYLLPASVKQHLGPWNMSGPLYLLIAVSSVVACCVPIYLLIERPFMNGPGSRYIEKQLRSFPFLRIPGIWKLADWRLRPWGRPR